MNSSLLYKENIKKYSEGLGAITFISESYFELKDVIDEIKNSDYYRFNIGKPQEIDLKDTLVLTISSILFFETYDLLDKLRDNFDIHILNSTVEYFLLEEDYIYSQLNEEYKRYEDTIYIDKSDIEERIDKYTKNAEQIEKILDWFENCNIIEVYGAYEPEDELDENNVNYIDDLFIYADLDSGTYAARMDYTLLVDDYVTSEVFRDLFNIKRDKISNLAGFINTVYIYNLKEYYKLIKELIGNRYNYVIDKSSLLKMSYNIKDNDNMDLDDILELMVKSDVNGYYKMLIKDTLHLDSLEHS